MPKKTKTTPRETEPHLDRPLVNYRVFITQTVHADVTANSIDLHENGSLTFGHEFTPDEYSKTVAGFKEWISFLIQPPVDESESKAVIEVESSPEEV